MMHSRDTAQHQESYVCTECSKKYDPLVIDESWIECDHCGRWFHCECVDLLEIDLDFIDQFHCNDCQDIIGPSTLKEIENYHRHNQYEKNPKPCIQAGTDKFVKHLLRKQFGIPGDEVFHDIPADQLNITYLIKNGFDCPILVRDKQGLGMKVPPENFGVQDVMELLEVIMSSMLLIAVVN